MSLQDAIKAVEQSVKNKGKLRVQDSKSPMFKSSLVYKPFIYPEFYDIYKEHEKVHWVTEEAELGDDIADWRLDTSDEERLFIKTILTIFTTGDVAVAQNYRKMFLPVFQNNEISNWLSSVVNREATHQDAYAMANEVFGFPDSMFAEFQEFIEMRERIDLMQTDYDVNYVSDLALGLAHTVFNEGVALFGAFVCLLNFHRFDVEGHNGKRGRYKGLAKVNKWSLREESLHVDAAALLHKKVIGEHLEIFNDEFKKSVYDLARKMVEAEDKFLDLAFQNFNMKTITKEDVKTYIRFMVDRRLNQLGYKSIYNVGNPCEWVDEILGGVGGKKLGNFFEVRVDDYQASGAIIGTADWDIILKRPDWLK